MTDTTWAVRPLVASYGSKLDLLWRLWHDEEVGEHRSLDVFPFITFDQSGEESLSWSWLYKLIRYERKGEAKALNLLFLPAIRWGGGDTKTTPP